MTAGTVVKSSAEALHLTSTSGASLSSSTQLEETSTLSLSTASTNAERMNLNSDGYSRFASTWRKISGSIDFTVARGSTVQGLIQPGDTAYLHVITNAGAGPSEEKGRRYEIVFSQVETKWEAAALVSGTASFDVNGGPTIIMGA